MDIKVREDIHKQVKREMESSELSSQRSQAKRTYRTVKEQFDNLELLAQKEQEYRDAQDAAAYEKELHYYLPRAEAFFQASKQLYNIENRWIKTWFRDNLKKTIYSHIGGQEPSEKKRLKEDFSRNSEKLAFALLRKYPNDPHLRGNIENIRTKV